MSNQSYTFLLNVGLARPAGTLPALNTPDRAIEVLENCGFQVWQWCVKNSTTEPTLVAQVMWISNDYRQTGPDWESWLYRASKALEQDCIAVRNVGTGDGTLIGPKAAAWGPFNPAYFLDFSSNE